MDEQIEFRISSGLKDIIGRDLISDDFIAVFELVKNSFDAHATLVKLIFENDKLIIWDDGKGMTYDEIKQKWLFVGYSAKKTGEEDEELEDKLYADYRSKINITKSFAGAKGIGRFSCDRLGKHLLLTTKKVAVKNKVEQLFFDWTKFEKNPKGNFTDVKVIRKEFPDTSTYSKFKYGTILEITKLRSTWDRSKLLDLKHSLEKLINPFDIIDDEKKKNSRFSFSIDITCEKEMPSDELEKQRRWRVNGPVRNFIFETLGLKTTQIFTEITEDGASIITELIDRGSTIYRVKEKNNFSLLSSIKYHLFYLNRSAKNNFYRLMRIHSVEFGSVFLYRNGIRVYPFGEEGEDSFGIDRRKQQGYGRFIGSRELVGRIEIFGKTDEFNEEFKETSSRDGGLKRTRSYEQMQQAFFDYCLKRLERYVVDLQWTLKDNSEDLSYIEGNVSFKSRIINILSKLAENKNLEILYYNKDLIDILSEKIQEDFVDSSAFNDLETIAEKTKDKGLSEKVEYSKREYLRLLKQKEELEKKARDEEEARLKAELELELEKEKNTYLRSSNKNLSEDAKGLVHNIKITSKEVINSVDILIEKIRKETISQKELLRRLGVIKYNSEKVLKISKLITRSNFKTQANSQIVDIVRYTQQYFEIYSDIYDDDSIMFEIIPNKSSFTKKISVLDLSLIYDDLISNATKAGASKILVECVMTAKKKLDIWVSDDGGGIDKKFWADPEKMFELGITTTEGSGIGLNSVRKQLKEMNAKITFEGNGIKLRGANFKITFD